MSIPKLQYEGEQIIHIRTYSTFLKVHSDTSIYVWYINPPTKLKILFPDLLLRTYINFLTFNTTLFSTRHELIRQW